MLASFALAVQFLTRFPLNIRIEFSDKHLGQSVLFYPLIGLLIGGALALLAYVLPAHATALNAALILSLWVLITGGLHLDGLADCSDAWVGGLGDKSRSLAIMKDPAAGPIAVSVLVLLLLLKWSALQQLLSPEQTLLPLLIAPFLARLSILILMLSTPYIRENGLGSAMQQHLPKQVAIVISAIALAFCAWFCSIYIVLNMLFIIGGIRYLALQRLQGMTGDVYGASVEIIEAAVLISWVFIYG
ncbi:MAG: adenosylcobinamide-GDP ribazoletransferase [Methyloprofundus sp.]|nr:adenosylcobinamide-GDP ribazoletransferase [Methyloprofundus sp.]MBW6454141.1 adenosylcobinamide-GDP ribazoletransferase [Methyloprofundus sp.]